MALQAAPSNYESNNQGELKMIKEQLRKVMHNACMEAINNALFRIEATQAAQSDNITIN